jgi:acyl-CoA synthetase (AMP-forming)/AMP-acid ligase II
LGTRRLTPEDVRDVRSYDLLERWASIHPDKPGIGCDGSWITYGEWQRRAQRRAAELADGEVSPVALVYDARDGIEFAVTYVAAHAARRPALVLNPRLTDRDLQVQIDLAGAGLVTGGEGRDLAAAARRRAEPLVDRWGEPIADISFSSGTTGEPKGILLSHWALAWSGALFNETVWAARTAAAGPGAPLSGDDTLVSAFQAGSSATSIGFMNCGLPVGARLHFLSKFDAGSFSRVMAQIGATAFYGAPAHLALWRQAEPDATPSAHVYLLIGQAIPCADAAWFVARPGGAQLVNCYGLTESCAGAMVAVDDEIADNAGAIGRPLESVEVRLIGDDGADDDVEGELVMRCFGMMEGYLDRPDLTAQKLRDGWLHTGDVVERRGDAYFIRGRIGDRINRGGYKFDPLEVEEVAAAVAGVSGAVACAVPHPVLGEDVALAVEVLPSHDLDDVRAAVKAALERGLPSFKVPREVRAVRRLPRAGLGKPQRAAVAALLRDARETPDANHMLAAVQRRER